MMTLPTDYSHQQLVDALLSQFNSFIADGFEDELDMTLEEYQEYLKGLTHSQLITETGCDEEYVFLSDFMYAFT
jgi:hypothetical protein